MPRHAIPDELFLAASRHVRETHGEKLRREEIGRPTARRSAVSITWQNDPQLGLMFRCRRCPEGYDRYLAEVELMAPTPRLLTLADDHFKREHKIPLPPAAVWHEGNKASGPLAEFMPMTAILGASILCQRCPQGMNHIFLTPPPYGDARRIRYLLSAHPELRQHTLTYSPREQAEYVEAWDRKLLQQRDRLSGRRALGRAKTETDELSPLDAALGRLLKERAPDGLGITEVIKGLHQRSLDDQVTFTCELAAAVPGFADLVGEVPTEQLARAVASALGCSDGTLPATNEHRLWQIWQRVRPG